MKTLLRVRLENRAPMNSQLRSPTTCTTEQAQKEEITTDTLVYRVMYSVYKMFHCGYPGGFGSKWSAASHIRYHTRLHISRPTYSVTKKKRDNNNDDCSSRQQKCTVFDCICLRKITKHHPLCKYPNQKSLLTLQIPYCVSKLELNSQSGLVNYRVIIFILVIFVTVAFHHAN